MKKILIPLPSVDFDPSEAAIGWKILKKDFEIVFATPSGKKAMEDPIMMTGKGLGIFAPFMIADGHGKKAMSNLKKANEFINPIKWDDINSEDYDAIYLPGGHAKGVKEYLESDILQNTISEFFKAEKPVAAVCHGVVLVARSKREDGKSVLYGRKTTALTKKQELLAYKLTKSKMGDYYLTYPDTTVEDEVKDKLEKSSDFSAGPLPILRDNPARLKRGFIVQDGNYFSARWPGDMHLLATRFKQYILGEAYD